MSSLIVEMDNWHLIISSNAISMNLFRHGNTYKVYKPFRSAKFYQIHAHAVPRTIKRDSSEATNIYIRPREVHARELESHLSRVS